MPINGACSKFNFFFVIILILGYPIQADDQKPEKPVGLIDRVQKQSQQINLLLKNNELQKKELDFLKKENNLKTREIEDIRFQQNLISKNKKDQKLIVRLNNKYHLGYTTFTSNRDYGRYFVSEIIIINLTDKSVRISKEMVTLLVDGKPFIMKEIPALLKRQSFSINNQMIRFANLNQLKDQVLLPGMSMTAWMTFTHLPPGTHIPKLELKLQTPNQQVNIDINEFARKQLLLTVEELGPKKTLAYLNISGTVNTINIGNLIKVLDQLASKQVTRVVINWSDSAQTLSNTMLNWFKQAALSYPGRHASSYLPMVHASIRELHLANLPNTIAESDKAKGVFHKNRYQAVQAALESAFEVIPRSVLMEEIKNGHPLVKAAAIASGGGRLPPEDLPMLLKFADDDDINIQKSALHALKHFGEEDALKKLIHYIKKNVEPLSGIATESLALSRYSSAQDFLLELLKNEPPESKKKIVRILAKHPRLAWNDVIYQYASDPNGEIVLESLKALVQIGHPDLTKLLSKLLSHSNREISELAFSLLANRYDRESESIAMDHALKIIEERGLITPVQSLLKRTKDPRAIPVLLKKLDQSSSSGKNQIIYMLAIIGNQDTAEELYKRYQKSSNRDKKDLLTALFKLNSSRFFELAKKEIGSDDRGILQALCKGLQNEGSPESIQLIIKGFEIAKRKQAIDTFSQSLATISTNETRIALYKSYYQDSGNKKNSAGNALIRIRSSSPGRESFKQGNDAVEAKDWKKAITQYSAAINLDPFFVEAYSERGKAYLQLKMNKEAQADFIQTNQLNPYNSFAVTGVGTTYVVEGKIEQAIKIVEDSRTRFPKDPLYAYNTACVYSLACEYLKKQPELKSDLISRYEDQAIKDLKLSIDYGFNSLPNVDADWIGKDPDLNTLHELEAFQKIINPEGKEPSPKKPAG